jgi:hypothetical protein
MRKKIKNVNVKNCFNTLIICLLALLVAFVPFIFGSGMFVFFFETLPFIGDGSVITATQISYGYTLSCFFTEAFPEIFYKILEIITNWQAIAYFAIIGLDIVFAVLLIVTRFSFLRVLFKIISILLGIILILLTIFNLLYIFGYVLMIFNGEFAFQYLFNSFGVLPVFASLVFCVLLIGKQFTWFKKLY